MEPNIAGLLCYVPCCIGLVFSVVAAIVEKQSRFVRFHAFQSLLVHAVAIVLGTGPATSRNVALAAWRAGLRRRCCSPCVGCWWASAFLGLTIFLMIKANSGEEFELPVIGPMARQWV